MRRSFTPPISSARLTNVLIAISSLEPKLNVIYSWSGTGVTGNGTTASVATASLAAGTYTVKCGVKEGMPGKEGLCHISELADFRVRRTEDVVKMGDMIWVKCVGVDERSGKVRLSRKAAMKDLGKQRGCVSLCIGGGEGIALIGERP